MKVLHMSEQPEDWDGDEEDHFDTDHDEEPED